MRSFCRACRPTILLTSSSTAALAEYYLNHREQAARDFDRAFERDPSLLPANVGKALSYSIKHDNARGLKLLQQTEDKIEERGVSDAGGHLQGCASLCGFGRQGFRLAHAAA